MNIEDIKKGCTLTNIVDMNPNLVYLMMKSEEPCYIKNGKVFKLK
jgi:hypothetical protein